MVWARRRRSASRKELSAGASFHTVIATRHLVISYRDHHSGTFIANGAIDHSSFSPARNVLSMKIYLILLSLSLQQESRTIQGMFRLISRQRQHITPFHARLLGIFFDGVTTRVFIDQLLLQLSDSPDGELQLALRTFLDFARGAGSLLHYSALTASIEQKLTKHSPCL